MNNHQKKILEMINDGMRRGKTQWRPAPGSMSVVNVYHDDWCRLLRGKGECNCNPDVEPPRRVDKP